MLNDIVLVYVLYFTWKGTIAHVFRARVRAISTIPIFLVRIFQKVSVLVGPFPDRPEYAI